MEFRQPWRHLHAGHPDLEDGTAYSPKWTYTVPSHNSKTVLSIVKIGPPEKNRTVHREQRDTPICEYAFTDLA